MAITVGQFREFLSDSAGSMADRLAGRILDRVMGSTMRRLSREGEWTWQRKRVLITLDPPQESTNLTLTEGSVNVPLESTVLGSFPLLKRFYDEKWNIRLGGRETIYQFAQPPLPYSMKLTAPYAGASTPVTIPATYDTLSLNRSRYRLPDRFSHLFSLELPQQGVAQLSYLSRTAFEVYRRGLLTSASQPWVYTFYGNEEIEVWPPASTAIELEIDYQAEIRYPEIGADENELVDWPDQYEDMLWAIGRLQLAIELGADAVQFDVNGVMEDYQRMLTAYKAKDQSRARKTWLMGATGVSWGTPRPMGLDLRGPIVGEA